MDGTNHGIPISQTPINKKKVIPNTRPETNNLKEENQYGPQVQALELTLMNPANVTINKAQKITYGMTNGEIDLSEGYIAKLQERAAKKLEGFMKEMGGAIVHQPLLHWEELNNFEDKFEKVMLEAIKENDEEEQKYYVDKEKTLILRILDYKAEYLLWVYNFDVPFILGL